jgi:hypothetical protein
MKKFMDLMTGLKTEQSGRQVAQRVSQTGIPDHDHAAVVISALTAWQGLFSRANLQKPNVS